MGLRYSISIATKMIAMVTLVIIVAIVVVVGIATDLYRDESVARSQESNQELATHLADRVFTHFQDLTSKMSVMAQFAATQELSDAKLSIENVMGRTEDMIAFSAYKTDQNLNLIPVISVHNGPLIVDLKIDVARILPSLQNDVFIEQRLSQKEFLIFNSSRYFGQPIFSIALIGSQIKANSGMVSKGDMASPPSEHRVKANTWIIRGDFRQDAFVKFFAKQRRITSYVVDQKGSLFVHSNPEFKGAVIRGTNFSNVELVNQLRDNGSADNLQSEYNDFEGQRVLGAYKKIGVGDLSVITEIPRSRALAAIQKFQYRSFLVMIVVVCMAFIVNFLFSQSIISPLKTLFEATARIVEGRFDVRVSTSGSDEVGALSRAFLKMAAGLRERDKLKGAFNKFHSKEIAKKLLSGDIKLGGERKTATVFFSDIRSFTSISDTMTPDQVVTMLNEYMTEMVNIIYKWQGVVDKYIGDAIMAVWGVPEMSADDAYNSVRAALEMREALIAFNSNRKASGKPEIKIGIGLHTGEVLAGNIGSDQRLEYTVIGDTVNQASRVESANKPLQADILITSATAALVKDKGIELGPPLTIHAKGKKNALIVHKVIGYLNEQRSLVTTLSHQDIEEVKQQKVTLSEAEEAKVSVTGNGSDSKVQSANTIPDKITNDLRDEPPSNSPESSTQGGPRPQAPSATNFQNGAVLDHRMFFPQVSERYFVQDFEISPNPIGPFDFETLKLKLRVGQLNANALVMREGDTQARPIATLPGLERKPMPPIQHAEPQTTIRVHALDNEWYIAGPNQETYGPFTLEEVRKMVVEGNITRTTYAWNKAQGQWIYVYQIPGFDRRDVA